MHISLAYSCANGFNKWCETHDAGREGHSPAGADDMVFPDPDADPAVMAPPEQPHRPWLVPGAGTL
jgi:hypothetical protein